MGPADEDPRPESADRETGALNRVAARQDNLADQAGQREHAADQREAQADQRERAAAMDRCEALLRRQVQRSGQEQSATDRETARSRRDAGP